MLNKEEIKQWLLENCVDEMGNLDLSGLDFSDFRGTVIIGSMKVGGNLMQGCQEASGVLWQSEQDVGATIFQENQKVGGYLFQDNQTAEKDIYQSYQKSGGSIYQASQKAEVVILQDSREIGIAVDRADAPKPSILKAVDRFTGRESAAGFLEACKKYAKGGE